MSQHDEWAAQLEEAEGKLAEAYEILAALHQSLRDEGLKKDSQAIGEAVDRIARYGRLFQDIRAAWADPDQ